PQYLPGAVGIHLLHEPRVHRQGVGGDDRDADTGRGDLQIRQPEDLAGLVADLQLLRRPAVVLQRAGPRYDVQRQRGRERAEIVADHPADVARRGPQIAIAGDLRQLVVERVDAVLTGPGGGL